jgi:hypothetical protein
VRRFTAADDLLHDVAPSEHGRESLFFVLPVPEHRLLGLVYLWRDAAPGNFGRLVAFAGDVAREPLALDVADGLALEGDDLDDCTVGGLHVRQPEPLRTAELRFAAGDVALDVRVRGLHEPFSWHDGADGCPPWAADDRFEQSVTTEGSFTVAGRTVEFTGIGHRDHSWGTRDWRALQHWKWINAATLDGELSVHAWTSYALGAEQVNGYVNRSGTVTPFAAVRAAAELDDAFMHRRVRGTFTATDGTAVELDATAVAGVPIPARHLLMHEVACDATLDGRPAVAQVELGWPASYVADFLGERA